VILKRLGATGGLRPSYKQTVAFGVVSALRMTMLSVVTPCGLVGSPEDGDSVFFRDVGDYIRVYTASQLRTTS
jgi:hypothetical protein